MDAFGDVDDLGVRALGLALVSPATAPCVAAVAFIANTSALVAVWGKVRQTCPHGCLAWFGQGDIPGVEVKSMMTRWTRRTFMTSLLLYFSLSVAPSTWKSGIVLGRFGKAKLAGGAARGPFALPKLLSLASSMFLSLALQR